ncbi:MAG TPA: S28 family serine protease [Bacteroidia bacterium]|nr:S28 family serine protease [Bacteroidia bacterium]
MKKIKTSLLLLMLLLIATYSFSREGKKIKIDLQESLAALFPKADIKKIDNLEGFSESYQIILDEPIDHKNKEKGTFSQYIYLSHFDFKAPMVIVTEGYAAQYVKNEVSELLNTNQVIVEYRFYGKSRPDPIPWDNLTCDQAVEDYHTIASTLKKLYTGKWISTGISKGGETTLIYKSKYPDDIDIAIPYVAPLINGVEDKRTQQHINTIGTAECRAQLLAFQRNFLQNREPVLKIMEEYAKRKQMTFTEVPMNEAIEYAALEFPFSFWQWGGKCDEVPGKNATAQELVDYMNKIVGLYFYSDKKIDELLPSFYQHMRELGYYGFDLEPVKDLLQVVKSSSNSRFAPHGVTIKYDPEYIQKVRRYVETKGNRILYIYGGNDTWVSCSPTPLPNVDALKMVLPGGSHATRIKKFPPEDQQKIMKTLKQWLLQSNEKG